MKLFGKAAVSDFLDDCIVYRNLVPVDKRLPDLSTLGPQVGLVPGRVPRKSESDYARVILALLQQASGIGDQYSATGNRSLERLVFIGDTRLNDGTAFANICRAGGWPGIGFIGSETTDPAHVELVEEGNRILYLSNRWSALYELDQFFAKRNFVVDGQTAVIVDLDKTALGARGRNAHTIDQARVQAVQDTVADLLGDDFDQAAFRASYDRLNQVEYHPFTTDNQDYLAYICLILGTGLYELDGIETAVAQGNLTTFNQFIEQVNRQANELPPALATIHREIYANTQAGDPTPFKAFRRTEYRTTVGRMGHLADNAPVEQILAEEIVITREVLAVCLAWRERGALLFGLSDKPDEASLPTAELAVQGYVPIHRQPTHVVGSG
jgi:hypothetical protein